jgi:spermidine/putrescine transport system permease protein
MREHRIRALLMAPATAIFFVLFVLPLAYFFVISFWRKVLFAMQPDFTFANYGQVYDQHRATLVFTLGLAFIVAALTATLGFFYAYIIRFKAGRWGPALLFISLITMFGGYLVKIYAWMTILGIKGVLNSALLALGVIDEPLTWLYYNAGAVVVTLVNFSLPLAILPIYASMRGITDIELEAARDLGAGGWRSFADIVVPRSRIGITAAFGLTFLLAGGDYLTPQLVGGKVNMIGVQISAQFGLIFNWPMGAAMSFVTLGSSSAVALFTIWLFSQWRPR